MIDLKSNKKGQRSCPFDFLSNEKWLICINPIGVVAVTARSTEGAECTHGRGEVAARGCIGESVGIVFQSLGFGSKVIHVFPDAVQGSSLYVEVAGVLRQYFRD